MVVFETSISFSSGMSRFIHGCWSMCIAQFRFHPHTCSPIPHCPRFTSVASVASANAINSFNLDDKYRSQTGNFQLGLDHSVVGTSAMTSSIRAPRLFWTPPPNASARRMRKNGRPTLDHIQPTCFSLRHFLLASLIDFNSQKKKDKKITIMIITFPFNPLNSKLLVIF